MKTYNDLLNAGAAALGISSWDGVPSNLDPDRREQLYDAMADIVAASPGDYPQHIQDWAAQRKGSTLYHEPLPSYSIGQAVSDFGGEVANQAVDINDKLNPFSEKNRTAFYYIALLGVASYFLLPVIGELIGNLQKKK